MFCFLLLSRVLCVEQTQEEEEKIKQEVARILEVTTKNPENCPINLTNSIITYCSNINEIQRRELAIQLMICEMAKDGRQSSNKYFNDEQFLHDLNADEFAMYTSFFTNIDSVCFQSTHEFQYFYSNQKVKEVSAAVNFSSDFLKLIGEKISNQTHRSEEDLKEIEEAAAKSNELLENIVKYVGLIWKDFEAVKKMTKIEKSIRSSIKLYAEVLVLAFIGAFILPNILPTIVSLTVLCMYLEFNEIIKINLVRCLHIFYISMSIMITFTSFCSRVIEIKRRIFPKK